MDENLNHIVDDVLKWNLQNNEVTKCKPMPYKQIDFAICLHRELVFCIGGCFSFFKKEILPRNAYYNTQLDTWQELPVLKVPGLYVEHYQRLCLTMFGEDLLAFWLCES